MLLILKGKPPKPICRACRALHGPKDCPKRRHTKCHTMPVDWRDVRRISDQVYALGMAYQEAVRRRA